MPPVARCAACDPTAACTHSRTGRVASRKPTRSAVRRSATSTRTGRVVRTEESVEDRVLVATFTFDVKGNVVEHVDPGGNTTRFAYDLLSRLLRSERPGSAETVVVDPAGNPVETRAGQHALLRTFDIANRIVAVRHDAANAPPVLQCTYHDNGASVPTDAGVHTAGGRPSASTTKAARRSSTTTRWSHRHEAHARTRRCRRGGERARARYDLPAGRPRRHDHLPHRWRRRHRLSRRMSTTAERACCG